MKKEFKGLLALSAFGVILLSACNNAPTPIESSSSLQSREPSEASIPSSNPSEVSLPSSEPSVPSFSSQDSSEPSSAISSESTILSSSSSKELEYYSSIDWTKSGKDLKTDLATLISKNTVDKGYAYAYTAYPYTDVDDEGKIIDVYSSYRYDPETDHQGAAGKSNYNKEGQMFNREHTIPQSVFNENAPMKSDLHHLLPTDAYVNNQRSNYPHAYVSSAKYTSTNKTLVGSSDSTKNGGYSGGNVCEVPDEYKGDIARIYFYMVTRYESKLSGWKTYDAFSKNAYPSLSKWAVQVYLEWNDLDPVSEKEIKRNEEVYKIQKNRNPFIDNQDAAHSIWDNAY